MIPIEPFESCADSGYIFHRLIETASVDRGKEIVVAVSGGVPPYGWYVTGNAFEFESGGTREQYNKIRTTQYAIVGYSVEEVTVTDSCGNETDFIVQCCFSENCCDSPDYEFTVEEEANVALHNIRVQGGCPPFTWELFGELISFGADVTNNRVNYVIGADNTDIYAVYKVTDACDQTRWGEIVGENYSYTPDYFTGCLDTQFCLTLYGYSERDITPTNPIYDSSPIALTYDSRIVGQQNGSDDWPYIEDNAVRLDGTNFLLCMGSFYNKFHIDNIGQISFDFKLNSYGSFYLLNSFYAPWNYYDRITVYANTTRGLRIETKTSSTKYISGSVTPIFDLDTWYHIDIVKENGGGLNEWKAYINWYSFNTFTTALGTVDPFYVWTGARTYVRIGEGLDGWIRNIKFMNGAYETI